jgi:hypothetical protein
MKVIYDINLSRVIVSWKIILLFTTLFAHPHTNHEMRANPHSHPQNENDLRYDLDQFNDLNFQSSNPSNSNNSEHNQDKKNLILLNDNLYLIDDDFDFGKEEFKLQKMEILTDDLKMAKEYEDFLSSFYKEATFIGSQTSSSKVHSNETIVRLQGENNNLEYINQNLNKKVKALEKRLINRKQAAKKEDVIVDSLESEKRLLNQKIKNLEKKLQVATSNKSYDDIKKSYDNLKEEFTSLKKISEPNVKNETSSRKLDYRVSAIMGATIPIMQEDFSIGPNIGLRLDIPVSFTLAGREVKVGTDIYFSMMLPKDGIEWYFLNNIVGNVSISPFNQMKNQHLSSVEIISGLGLTLASIGNTKKTTLSIPIDLIYYIPMDLAGFEIGINLLGQLTFGHPEKEGIFDTTSLINIGLVIKTPLRF